MTPTVSAATPPAPPSTGASRSVPLLPPSAAKNPDPVPAHKPNQTTTGKSAVHIPSPPPAATLRKRVRPLHSESTPAQYRHPEPPPPAATPAPHPLFFPSAQPPNNADSVSFSPVPHSLPLKRGSTRCQFAEKPAVAHSGAKFVGDPSSDHRASFPRIAARSGKCPPPIPGPASPACSAFPAA